MPMINGEAVKRLFRSNGFSYGFGLDGSKFVYGRPAAEGGAAPFSMQFAAPWLHTDPTAEYDLASVRKMLTAMVESAKAEYEVYVYLLDQSHVDAITGAMRDFGMTYDGSDGHFYYVRDGKAVFGVDCDYIASLICTGKATIDKLGETLGDMLETADYEAGQSKRARKLENGTNA